MSAKVNDEEDNSVQMEETPAPIPTPDHERNRTAISKHSNSRRKVNIFLRIDGLTFGSTTYTLEANNDAICIAGHCFTLEQAKLIKPLSFLVQGGSHRIGLFVRYQRLLKRVIKFIEATRNEPSTIFTGTDRSEWPRYPLYFLFKHEKIVEYNDIPDKTGGMRAIKRIKEIIRPKRNARDEF